MECPNCGGAMWDNRATKTNPKGPDFRCKSPDCIDPATGRQSAVWIKQMARPAAPVRPVARPVARPAAPVVIAEKREMVMSYSKDVIVAQMAAGQPVENPFKSIIFGYRLLLREVKAPGSVIFKGDQAAPESLPQDDLVEEQFPGPDQEQDPYLEENQ